MLPNNKPATTTTTVVAPVTAPTTVSTTQPTASSTSTSSPISAWRWPTDGKVIENFSGAEGGNKGIDIAGSKGQAIVATADGRVVYAGNALRGYGNLIIIKHNDDYLSAYAHNDTMLVREQQEVKAGRKSLPWVAPEPAQQDYILKFVTRGNPSTRCSTYRSDNLAKYG